MTVAIAVWATVAAGQASGQMNGGHAAGGTTDWPAVHTYVPDPAWAEETQERELPLSGIQMAPASAEPHPKDTMVLLVVLDERVRQTQWLVAIQGPTAVADAEPARARSVIFYGLDGRAIEFPDCRETYRVVALGPRRVGAPQQPIRARIHEVRINGAFLNERLVNAADFMMRAARARAAGRLGEEEWFTVLPAPPDRPDAAARQRFVEEAGLSVQDERAIAATVPMLNEFTRVIAVTPGLREVLFSIVEKPSFWSVVTRLGQLETDFRFRSGEVVPSAEPPLGFAGIGPCSVVPFTFSIQGRPAIECTLLVAAPQVPLRMSGGIVALVATSPNRSEVRLIVRLLATRPGMPPDPAKP